MVHLAAVAAMVPLVAWIAILLFRGRFWLADQRLDDVVADLEEWPQVVAVVPARNEAATVGRAVASLMSQNYPGALRVVVVDDGSNDGTADAARAGVPPDMDFLTVLAGQPLASGWTGKLWAVDQGLRHVDREFPGAVFLLLTDADIAHEPGNLRRLVAKAEGEGLDMVSLMALLNCRSPWERLLIPAFVFFFQKLYPFPLVNDPSRRQAAAAGGCMLVRRAALGRAGGVAAIRDRLIDDCALAALIKESGSIWIGLTRRVVSLRAYDRLGDIWDMVARGAFDQLRHSAVARVGTLVGMTVLYLGPPAAVAYGLAAGDGTAGLAGVAAWLAMSMAYSPTLRLYGLALRWAPSLPLAALLFTLMTADSARRHWLGRGGAWKGRNYPRRESR